MTGYREESNFPRTWFEARERLLRWEVPPPAPSPEVPGDLRRFQLGLLDGDRRGGLPGGSF